MVIIPIDGQAPMASAIEAAVHALDSGFVVALPTDTGYALVADVSYTGSADRLFAMKRRSRDYALPILVSDIDQAMSLTVGVPAPAQHLMEKFWPGALTLVLPRHPDFIADLGSDDETVGVRCPAALSARLLCDETGPLATTSASIGQGTTPVAAEEIIAMFGDAVAVVLDEGRCEGLPATVVDCTGEDPKLLREGAIEWEQILSVLD